MADEDDDIILSELPDDELVPQMMDDLYDGLKEEIEEGVNILLERGWAPYKILTEALVAGMRILDSGVPYEVEQFVVGSWLQSDMAVTDEFNAVMETRFADRSSDPSRFWGSLAGRFSELEDYQVFAGVMPWLTRSEGEDDFHRKRLVAMVEDRFDGLKVQ